MILSIKCTFLHLDPGKYMWNLIKIKINTAKQENEIKLCTHIQKEYYVYSQTTTVYGKKYSSIYKSRISDYVLYVTILLSYKYQI